MSLATPSLSTLPETPPIAIDLPSEAEAAEARQVALAEIARVEALASRHDVLHQGLRVRWRRFGPAQDVSGQPPLVLLHGGHGSWMHWLRNAEALSVGRTLWLPDLPGFHDSDTPPAPAAGDSDPLGPLLAALGGTLDQLIGAGTPIDLGGFSFGGFVAARFGAQRGQVRRMALVGSGGHGTLRGLRAPMINWRQSPDREAERAALQHNLGALMLKSRAFDALAFEIHDISCHGTRFRSKDVSLAGGLQQALAQIDAPQFVLWGEHDITADARPLVAQLCAEHPRRSGAVIDGAGHWVQYERAQQTNAQLLRWLAA